MLLPATCPVCRSGRAGLCPPCRDALRPAPDLPPPPGVDRCHALLAYEGAGRRLVSALKYRNHRHALPGLATAAASLVDPADVDVVAWAPTTPARRRGRGFDPAELLARVVARQLRRPCRRLLRRHPGVPQTGRRAADRWRGPSFSPRRRPGGRVLLVDDVITTGATVARAAATLRAAGAPRIVVLALARTPLKPTTERDETTGVKPPVSTLSDEVWSWLCGMDLVRPSAVEAGRARVAANDWPEPIAVADAVLRGCLHAVAMAG